MVRKFTIALLQISPLQSEQENLAKGLRACEQARELGADLVVFPELWQVGYHQPLFTRANARDRNSPFMQQFCAKARELEMAIAITYLGKTDLSGKVQRAKSEQKPTNNLALIDRTGSIVLEYSKVYVCDFKNGSDNGLRAGKDFHVTNLRYAQGTVCVGAMICFDREFPESARELARQGAEIIIVPNACNLVHDSELGDVRLQQIRSRAFENMAIVAVANYPEPTDDGNSCVCAANGAIIAQAGANEKILLAHIDLTALRTWRKKEVWGPR